MKIKDIYSTVTIDWCNEQLKLNGITQKELSSVLQLTKGTISKKLNKDSERPLNRKLDKIALYVAIKELIKNKK